MNIIEAVRLVNEAKKIKRKTWHHTHYIYCNNNDILFGRFEKEFVFALKVDDYLANDWEVVEK